MKRQFPVSDSRARDVRRSLPRDVRRSLPRGLLAVFALALGGCGESEPRQWLVSVATDAPVPQLGDHLLLEVIGGEASCSECLRLIGVDGPESLPVSFGVLPRTTGTVRVRARLYRAEQTGVDGLPDSAALIDAVGRLPPIDGETRVAFNLSAGCFGIPSLIDEGKTCDPASGGLIAEPELALLEDAGAQPEAGSWPEAAQVQCEGAVPDGMVCVPGGVFLLGSPRPGYVVDSKELSLPEHLVKLGPFALDADEVTVGVVRSLLAEGKLGSAPVPRGSEPDQLDGACTFLGAADAANDALPVNCLSHSLAQEVCSAQGKRLPTEAEWEYAAGNLTAETPYPWGAGGDLCAMALLGVGRNSDETGTKNGGPAFYENSGCRPVEGPSSWGPVAGGQPKDVTLLGVRNMSGSVSEWVEDLFAPYTDPCWQSDGVLLRDPVCAAPADPDMFASYRGSSWSGYKLSAKATARNGRVSSPSPELGVRCARSM